LVAVENDPLERSTFIVTGDSAQIGVARRVVQAERILIGQRIVGDPVVVRLDDGRKKCPVGYAQELSEGLGGDGIQQHAACNRAH
jgi:hypothetical protein